MASEQDLARAQELLLLSRQADLPPGTALPARLSAEGYRPLLDEHGLPLSLMVSRGTLTEYDPLTGREIGTRELPERLAAQAFTTDPEREIVIAFRGGGNWADYIGPDASVAFSNLASEFEPIKQWVADLKSAHPHASIVLTGHSLGGADAQYVASQIQGVSAVTFGAPGIRAALERAGLKASGDVLNYLDRGDFIGQFREHVGRVEFVGPSLTIDPFSFDDLGLLRTPQEILRRHRLDNYLGDFGLPGVDLSPMLPAHLSHHAALGSNFHTAAAYPLHLDATRAGLALTLSGPELEQLALPRADRFAGLELPDAQAAPWPARGWGFARDFPEVARTEASQERGPVDIDLVSRVPASETAPGGVAASARAASLVLPGPAPVSPVLAVDRGAWNDPLSPLSAGADGANDGRASAEPMPAPGRFADFEGGWRNTMGDPLDALPALVGDGYDKLEQLLTAVSDKVAAIETAPPRLHSREVIRIVREWIRRECNKPRHSSWRYDFGRTYTPPGPIPPC